jgi:NADPH2:quinone reductase
MARTIVVNHVGGPDVMKLVDMDPGRPGSGEVLLRQTAIGINFADVHYRRGTAPPHAMAKLPMPFTPGLEAAGVVEEIGPGVTGFKRGDRVGYATATLTIGAYTQMRVFPADRLFKIPDGVSDIAVAAVMYRGVTVHGMIRSCYKVKPGDNVLLHAAAGGVGSIVARWAKHIGANVIGTVSSEAKVDYARAQGCAHVIVTSREDFVKRAKELTNGVGVDVVFDGVGADTFLKSFDCIRRYGMMVSFGQAAGMMDPVDPVLLQHNGLYLTKFSGSTYNEVTEDYQFRAKEVLEAIAQGVLGQGNCAIYELENVAQAHRDFEDRSTTGSLVIRL